MNDTSHRIAFIILHYADREVTDRCVQSILRMDGADRLQIVIADNDGRLPDEEREALASHFKQQGGNRKKDNITVIRCPDGTGFSRANNIGYVFAREQLGADCIVICNNDIEFVQKDFPKRLEKSIRRMNCHVLGPNVIRRGTHEPQNPMDTRLRTDEEARYTIRMNRTALKVLPAAYPALKLKMDRQERKRLQEKRRTVDYYRQPHRHIVPFGACLIFTPLFTEREAKAFEPETQFYYEEYILTKRCFSKGYETGYDPLLKVMHESGSATKGSLRSGIKKMRFLMENTAAACEIYLNGSEMAGQRKKLLYFMSVDWNWIAQRPHFMALELAKEYDVTVLYPRYLYRPWKGQQNVRAPEKCYGVPQIPFQEKSRFLQRLGNIIFQRFIGNIHVYDIVWMGTPMFARLIPDAYRGNVVYDYMDDIAALQSDEKVAAYVRRAHAFLLRRADLIMVTSQYLMEGLDAGSREKAHLIRNAFRGENVPGDAVSPSAVGDVLKRFRDRPDSVGSDSRTRVGYVGTISGWMDFPLLLESLDKFPDLEYHMWGPSGVRIPEHERLICHGVIEHDRIREAVQNMDCLIMPFQVNDIVLAVDPVKLYEYISFGKNVICVRYPEVERFEPYVWFYDDAAAFEQLMGKLVNGELKIRYDTDQQKRFLEMNSWEERGAEVRSLLNEKEK